MADVRMLHTQFECGAGCLLDRPERCGIVVVIGDVSLVTERDRVAYAGRREGHSYCWSFRGEREFCTWINQPEPTDAE